MTLTCNLLAGASLDRKTVGFTIWRNTRELCVCLSHKQWKPCNIWPCRVPSALDFSPREPSTNSTAVVLVVATCHSVSPHPFLSLWQNGWAPVDQGVCVVRVGQGWPLQSHIPQNHTRLLSVGMFLFLTWGWCVVNLVEVDTVLVNEREVIC